ncbi:cytochrome P450 [Rubritalea spongiae]|uniref:Cytochrome P450 n=1 Tax=Rubritalea spongiae TaxID=430797 RepID=A0ABW5E5P9_9BACT
MKYTPLHPDTLADPFAVYAEIRREHPVFWHEELHAWIVSGYRDCKSVLAAPDVFSRNPMRVLGLGEQDIEEMTIQSHDPPHSMPLRRAISTAFEHVDVEEICQESVSLLEELFARQVNRGHFDFMEEVAAPVALDFATRLVGVRGLSVERYSRMFTEITRAMDSALEPQRQRAGELATEELNKVVNLSMEHFLPGSVLAGLHAQDAIKSMSFGYVRNTVSAMFNAAYSTAYTSMGSFLNLGLQDPSLVAEIKECDSMTGVVQELLRLTSPAQATMRFAAQDVSLGGEKIRKTDPLITLLASANRDSEMFMDADKFNPDRNAKAHLGFGWGPHFCVGAMPAQLFLRHYIERLGWMTSQVILSGGAEWMDTVTLRCLASLDLEAIEYGEDGVESEDVECFVTGG